MKDKPVVSDHDEQRATFARYVSGFVGSMFLTGAAYILATRGTGSKNILAIVLAILAIIQFVIQMMLFLHVGEERGPRWRLTALGFMLGVILILVFGSLWIMDNLNYHMTPKQINQYMKNQESGGF